MVDIEFHLDLTCWRISMFGFKSVINFLALMRNHCFHFREFSQMPVVGLIHIAVLLLCFLLNCWLRLTTTNTFIC